MLLDQADSATVWRRFVVEYRQKYIHRLAITVALIALSACDGEADGDVLIGKWAASQVGCTTEWIAFAEEDDARKIAWWRTTDDVVGPLPWRSGSWELRDGTIIMRFDHRVEHDRFLQVRIDEQIDKTVQFDLQDVGNEELRLVATAEGFSPEALLLGGTEKLFVKCES